MKQMYYSEILNKYFDSEEECVKAEEEHKAEVAKKEEAKALVKKESAEVNDAFAKRNTARKTYNEKVTNARKEYNEQLKIIQDKYYSLVREASEEKDEAEHDFDVKLNAFCEKHPEGFHITLKDGDNVVTYTNEVQRDFAKSREEFDKLFDSLINFRFPW